MGSSSWAAQAQAVQTRLLQCQLKSPRESMDISSRRGLQRDSSANPVTGPCPQRSPWPGDCSVVAGRVQLRERGQRGDRRGEKEPLPEFPSSAHDRLIPRPSTWYHPMASRSEGCIRVKAELVALLCHLQTEFRRLAKPCFLRVSLLGERSSKESLQEGLALLAAPRASSLHRSGFFAGSQASLWLSSFLLAWWRLKNDSFIFYCLCSDFSDFLDFLELCNRLYHFPFFFF